jgi:demethylmenaquinone methyltransferase/2-methoxy-6-polyprenyl-1,4-benzoquinol methylase
MSKAYGTSPLLRFYEWLHQVIPQSVDCRPIYIEQSVAAAGFEIQHCERVNLFGLPAEIVVGKPL